jgi:hypothetical protein
VEEDVWEVFKQRTSKWESLQQNPQSLLSLSKTSFSILLSVLEVQFWSVHIVLLWIRTASFTYSTKWLATARIKSKMRRKWGWLSSCGALWTDVVSTFCPTHSLNFCPGVSMVSRKGAVHCCLTQHNTGAAHWAPVPPVCWESLYHWATLPTQETLSN